MIRRAKLSRNVVNLFNIARAEAEKSNCQKAKVSAILTDYRLRTIYAKNHNRNYYGSDIKFSIHAEEGLIASYRKGFDNKILFVYRRKASGIGTSKPCEKCMQLIKESGVRCIMYFDESINLVEENV